MSFLGNSMLTFQEKQKFCTAFHGFNMIGWSITIGGRIINKNSNSAQMNNGSYLWNGNIRSYFLVCNQPIKLQWLKYGYSL